MGTQSPLCFRPGADNTQHARRYCISLRCTQQLPCRHGAQSGGPQQPRLWSGGGLKGNTTNSAGTKPRPTISQTNTHAHANTRARKHTRTPAKHVSVPSTAFASAAGVWSQVARGLADGELILQPAPVIDELPHQLRLCHVHHQAPVGQHGHLGGVKDVNQGKQASDTCVGEEGGGAAGG